MMNAKPVVLMKNGMAVLVLLVVPIRPKLKTVMAVYAKAKIKLHFSQVILLVEQMTIVNLAMSKKENVILNVLMTNG